MQIWIDLEANLDRFWEGFGGQVGSKLAPNGNKPDPTTNQKYDHFWEGLRKGFWKVFAPNLGPTWTILASRGRQIPDLWGWGRGASGRPLYPSPPKTPPRPSQDTPRPPQDLPKTPQDTPKTSPRPPKMLQQRSQEPARSCYKWGTNTARKSTVPYEIRRKGKYIYIYICIDVYI